VPAALARESINLADAAGDVQQVLQLLAGKILGRKPGQRRNVAFTRTNPAAAR
jgi:hypothetical protein